MEVIQRYQVSLGILTNMSHQVVYRSLLHLSWVDKLVDNIKTIFIGLYGDQLTKPHTTLVECHSFDEYFDQQLRELDSSSNIGSISPIEEEEASSHGTRGEQHSAPGLTYRGRTLNGGGVGNQDTISADSTPIPTPDASRPSTPGNVVVAKAGPLAKMSRRARKSQHSGSAPVSSGDESLTSKKKGAKATKKGRKWSAEGFADEEDDSVQLDYSRPNLTSDSEAEPVGRSSALDVVDSSTWGSKSKGKFILKDLGDEVHDLLASAEAEKAQKAARAESKTGLLGSGVNAISGLFRNVVGGKTLTKEDLQNAMKGMEDHLLRKNVAREAAVRLCEGVEKELVGVKTGNFESEFWLLNLHICHL
jgi:signal recognition particle receptor subunit alpha